MTSPARPAGAPALRVQVAEEVRAWLARRRISGAELARRIGRSQSFVAKRLDGRQALDMDDLQLIGDALGINPLELLSGISSRAVEPARIPDEAISRLILGPPDRRQTRHEGETSA